MKKREHVWSDLVNPLRIGVCSCYRPANPSPVKGSTFAHTLLDGRDTPQLKLCGGSFRELHAPALFHNRTQLTAKKSISHLRTVCVMEI